MAKEQRRGDREIRNLKAKSAVAAPISPFAVKSLTGAASTLKRKR